MLEIIDPDKRYIERRIQNRYNEALIYMKAYRASRNSHYLNQAKSLLREYKGCVQDLQSYLSSITPISSENILALFDIYFPDQYDVQENSVIVYFPEITVKDNNGMTHVVKEIYIKIEFTGYEPKNIDIYARRMAATPEEIFAGYCHSHISASAFGVFTSSVCFGDFSWRNSDFMLSLELLLINLRSFLETESSDTKPYALLSNVGVASGKYTENQTFILRRIEKLEFDLEFTMEHGIPVFKPVDNAKLETYLINNYPEALAYNINGNFYANQLQLDKAKIPTQYDSVVYKGETKTFTLLPTTAKPLEKTINTVFKNYFINNVKYQITEKLAAFAATISEPQAENIGQTVQEDSVFVFQD